MIGIYLLISTDLRMSLDNIIFTFYIKKKNVAKPNTITALCL